MSATSLLTIVKGRQAHLNNLLRGVAASASLPGEVVIIHMNEPAAEPLVDPGCPVRRLSLYDINDPLPLGQARNKAAAVARYDTLLFLDVDCIPSRALIGDLNQQVNRTRGLVMGNVRYLATPLESPQWTEDELRDRSLPHPRRPEIARGSVQASPDYHMFWSLCFGIRKQEFERTGGFDLKYTGYGAEDTDFAFMSEQARIPFFLSGSEAFHQYHATCSPPYNHFHDIIKNASTFRDKWGRWPMEGWLTAFQDAGLITWDKKGINVLREPDEELIEESINEAPFV